MTRFSARREAGFLAYHHLQAALMDPTEYGDNDQEDALIRRELDKLAQSAYERWIRLGGSVVQYPDVFGIRAFA